MPTPIFTNQLQLFLEADELAGADASDVTTFTDLSGNARHLTASSAKPLIKANAVNSKKSVIWDGSKNPLVYNGTFRIRCGFLLVKTNGNFGGDYQGVLSSPADRGILTGIGGSNIFYDFQYDYYEYRLNDRIYPKENAPAPTTGFGIIFFRFWQNLLVEGIQLGQDRDFTTRKFDGEVALLALYDRDFCESDVRKMTQSIAFSYQIAIANVFPYQGSKVDTAVISKRVLTDDQDEPVVRVKSGAKTRFDLTFTQRSQAEFKAARVFWNEFYPSKRFLYRDYQMIPPEDTICRFPVPGEFTRNGAASPNNYNYSFPAVESIVSPLYEIPTGATVVVDGGIPDPYPPSVPEGLGISGTLTGEMLVEWLSSSDEEAFGASGDDDYLLLI